MSFFGDMMAQISDEDDFAAARMLLEKDKKHKLKGRPSGGRAILATETFLKLCRDLPLPEQQTILAWIDKVLDPTSKLRQSGQALYGQRTGFWIYRLRRYRILCALPPGGKESPVTLLALRVV